MEDQEIDECLDVERLRRKADQFSELGSLASVDRDHKDAAKWFAKMNRCRTRLKELRG